MLILFSFIFNIASLAQDRFGLKVRNKGQGDYNNMDMSGAEIQNAMKFEMKMMKLSKQYLDEPD